MQKKKLCYSSRLKASCRMWRKNKLISGTSKQEDEKTKTTFFEYTLDAPLIVKDRKNMADIEVTIEEQGDIE